MLIFCYIYFFLSKIQIINVSYFYTIWLGKQVLLSWSPLTQAGSEQRCILVLADASTQISFLGSSSPLRNCRLDYLQDLDRMFKAINIVCMSVLLVFPIVNHHSYFSVRYYSKSPISVFPPETERLMLRHEAKRIEAS